MAFVVMSTPSAGDAILVSFAEDTIDNLDFLNTQIGSLGAVNILNGNFEIIGSASDLPANWTRTLFSGGDGDFDTTTPMEGSQSYEFVHPGGGGNGGGSLESDYFPITANREYQLDWLHWVDAAGMHDSVEVEYFTGAKVSISTEVVYDSVANPTSPERQTSSLAIPPTARFMKATLIGGEDDVDVAGSSYWDDVRLTIQGVGRFKAGAVPTINEAALGEGAILGSSLTTVIEYIVPWDGEITTDFDMSNPVGAGSTGQIYLDDVEAGALHSVASAPWLNFTDTIEVKAGQALQMKTTTDGLGNKWRNFQILVDIPEKYIKTV